MQFLIDGLQYILELIEMFANFLVTLVGSLIHFLSLLPSCIQMLMSAIAYLPLEVTSFAVLSISISVVFVILGRGRTN